MIRMLLIPSLFLLSILRTSAAVELPRAIGDIVIDGVLNEATWKNALRVELAYETSPGENIQAPVETVAYLTEDGRNLYVAFRADDPNPEKIRAWLRDRDSMGSGDFVGISLDTYNDGQRAFEFFANPLGVQQDGIRDDLNDRQDNSWDAIWDSAGKIDDNGYVVEMRIPLNQLRFQNIDGKQSWKYRVVRSYPRNTQVWMSNSVSDRNRNCQICQYSSLVGLEGSESANNLEIVPTLTVIESHSTDDPGVSPMTGTGRVGEAGVTMRYGITPEITANLAINPDFSQIEADGAQLDVNRRFELSYAEKRPFFLEGADYFSMPLQAVFTRTVVSPNIAAKLSGKRGANTIAVFAADDEATYLLFPGANGSDSTTLSQGNTAFVGRYARGFDGASSVGTVLTIRDGDDYKNLVAGFDARWRINDQNEVVAQVLRSETEYPFDVSEEFEQPHGKFSGDAAFLTYAYESRNWTAKAEYQQIDDLFRPDSGFIKQSGIEETKLEFGRKWHGDESNWWTRINLRTSYETKHDQAGQLLDDDYRVTIGLTGPLQSRIQVNVRSGREFESGQGFDVGRVGFFGAFEPFRGVEMGMETQFGDQVDRDNVRLGEQRRVKPFLIWNLNRHLLIRFEGATAVLDAKNGENIFDARVADARMTWQFNLRSSIRLTVQHTDIERNAAAYTEPVDDRSKNTGRQLLYSWKLNPQTVFFLGYSDTYVDDDNLESATESDRSWFMKVGYAWTI